MNKIQLSDIELLKQTNKSFFVFTNIENVKKQIIQELKVGTKVIDYLQEHYPTGFNAPCSFFINENELKVEDLDYILKEGDIFTVLQRPNDPVSILISVAINILISVAISFILSKLFPASNSKTKNVDEGYETVYSTNVSQIQAKKNGIVPVSYGVTRNYPNLITNQYTRYENNQQIIYLTTCIGSGQYDIIQAFLDDNKVASIGKSSTVNMPVYTMDDYDALYKNQSGGNFFFYIQYINWTTNEEIIIYEDGTQNRDHAAEKEYYLYLYDDWADYMNGESYVGNQQDYIDNNLTSSYNKYFDNSRLIPTNIKDSGNIRYCLLSTSDEIKNPAYHVNQKLSGGYYRHICREVNEVSQITLSDDYQEFGYFNINDKYGDIDKIEIDVVFNSGLYKTNDEGEFKTLTNKIRVFVYGYNDENETIYDNYFDYEYAGSSKKVLRYTHEIYVPKGKYRVKIKRLKYSFHKETQKNGDPTIERIKGFEVEKETKYKDISIAVFKILSNQDLSEQSSLSINLLTRRKRNEGDTLVSKYLTTLRDFVEDIWTNPVYGLGEDIEKLEIREELSENCNLCLDEPQNGFKTIADILKSYGYIFYPSFNKFVVERDSFRNSISYFFTENNSKDFVLNFSISKKDETGDGVLVKYLKQYENTFSEVLFPFDSVYPTETVLKGITTEREALAHAVLLYNKLNKRSRTASLTTELEGYVPELNSKVAVCRNFINESYSVDINYFEYVIDNLSSYTRFNISDKIKLLANTDYVCIISYKDGTFSNVLEVKNVLTDGYTNIVDLKTNQEIKDDFAFISVGKKEELFLEFIVESVSKGDSDNSIKLNLVEYNQEVYNNAVVA